jgi:hypothetical protein
MHNDHHGFVDEFSPDELRQMGYDRRDIKVRPILISVVGMFAFAIVSVIISFMAYMLLERVVGVDSPPVTVRKMPPPPILQTNITASEDMHKLRQEENARLNSKAWVDEKKGTVHIPIEQAIEILSETGLPTASEVEAAKAESTLGRKLGGGQ